MLRSSAGRDSPYKQSCICYKPGGAEAVTEIVKAILLTLCLAFFFYRSIWALPLMCIIGWFYLQRRIRQIERQRRQILVTQFKECILSAAASLRAGYAVENAFLESMPDMEMLYGKESMIYGELEYIRRGLVLNITLEELLIDLGQRSGAGEICEFAEVFRIAKRSGGNVSEIIRCSSEIISLRISAEEEIHTLLSSRKMEQKIMNIMPFGILLYIGFSNKGYFDELYHNVPGAAIMTACLLIYLAAYYLADRILESASRVSGTVREV